MIKFGMKTAEHRRVIIISIYYWEWSGQAHNNEIKILFMTYEKWPSLMIRLQ